MPGYKSTHCYCIKIQLLSFDRFSILVIWIQILYPKQQALLLSQTFDWFIDFFWLFVFVFGSHCVALAGLELVHTILASNSPRSACYCAQCIAYIITLPALIVYMCFGFIWDSLMLLPRAHSQWPCCCRAAMPDSYFSPVDFLNSLT